jgi:hypothetical protein
MVSKEEAAATFNALVNNTLAVASAVATGTAVKNPNERNYKLIAIVVLVLAVAVGGGVWWWIKSKKKAGAGKSYNLTPSVKGARPTSGSRSVAPVSSTVPGSGTLHPKS